MKKLKLAILDWCVLAGVLFTSGGVIGLVITYVLGVLLLPIAIIWAIYKAVTYFF